MVAAVDAEERGDHQAHPVDPARRQGAVSRPVEHHHEGHAADEAEHRVAQHPPPQKLGGQVARVQHREPADQRRGAARSRRPRTGTLRRRAGSPVPSRCGAADAGRARSSAAAARRPPGPARAAGAGGVTEQDGRHHEDHQHERDRRRARACPGTRPWSAARSRRRRVARPRRSSARRRSWTARGRGPAGSRRRRRRRRGRSGARTWVERAGTGVRRGAVAVSATRRICPFFPLTSV